MPSRQLQGSIHPLIVIRRGTFFFSAKNLSRFERLLAVDCG